MNIFLLYQGLVTLIQIVDNVIMFRASSQENLSLGVCNKRDSNQFLQLQRLARKLRFPL